MITTAWFRRPRTIRFAAAATTLVLAASLGTVVPAEGAGPAPVAVPQASVRSVSNPGSALAVIRTLTLPRDGRAVGVGPDLGDSIYIAAGDGFGGDLLKIDPVTLAQTGQVAVQNYPKGLAVSADDTVYVVNADSDTLSVIRGASMTTAATISVPDEPQAVALSRLVDDSVFISSSGTSNKISTVSAHSLTLVSQTALGMAASPYGLAVGADDSVYVSSYGGNKIRLFQPVTGAVSDASAASGPIGVAISNDDTVVYSNESGNTVKSFKSSSPGTQTSVAVTDPQGVAVSVDDTIYVAGRNSQGIFVIDPRTFTIDDSVSLGRQVLSVAVTRSGLVVTASAYSASAWIMATVSPSLTTASGPSGSAGSLAITGLPTGVTVDDSTVKSIRFGDDTVAWTRTPGTNTFTGPIPAGSGTVAVTVALNGGNSASAGNFTYTLPPPPPPIPPNPPTSVAAVAGDRSAPVTWSAPTFTGSFPVSTYQVISSPGGRICLTATTSCTVDGLTNGTTYTFTVQALTGAGWSAASEPSNAVTPSAVIGPSIVITGARDGRRIEVTGSTTGFGMGAILKPWVKLGGQSTYSQGRADVLVSMDGTFAWGRSTAKRASVYMETPDGSAQSNTVTIAAR